MNIWNWLNAIFGPQGVPIVLLLTGVLVFVYVLIGPTLWRDWQERKRLKHKLDDLLKAFRENSPQESKSDTAPRMQRTQAEDSKPEALATDINSEADILDQIREAFDAQARVFVTHRAVIPLHILMDPALRLPSSPDSTWDTFREVFKRVADDRGKTYSEEALRNLVIEHYVNTKRELLGVHPRDRVDKLIDIADVDKLMHISDELVRDLEQRILDLATQRILDLATTRKEQSEGLDSRQVHAQRKNT